MGLIFNCVVKNNLTEDLNEKKNNRAKLVIVRLIEETSKSI